MNDFHSGLLSKGPEESADGDHDHHLRHHRHNIHHYHWLWSSGQVGTVSHPKVQTLSNRTPAAQPAIAMEGGAADRNWGGAGGPQGGGADGNHSGEGQGGTHTTGNHRGEGGYHGVGGGRGGLAALHHICTALVSSQTNKLRSRQKLASKAPALAGKARTNAVYSRRAQPNKREPHARHISGPRCRSRSAVCPLATLTSRMESDFGRLFAQGACHWLVLHWLTCCFHTLTRRILGRSSTFATANRMRLYLYVPLRALAL